MDPIIANPASSQAANPYIYIGNNPLSGVDPTGYQKEDLEKNEPEAKTVWANVPGSRLKHIVGKATEVSNDHVSAELLPGYAGAGGVISYDIQRVKRNGGSSSSEPLGGESGSLSNGAENNGGGAGSIGSFSGPVNEINSVASTAGSVVSSGGAGGGIGESDGPYVLPNNVVPEWYVERLIEHLVERADLLAAEVDGMSRQEKIKRFGPMSGGDLLILDLQIQTVQRTLRMNESIGTGQGLVDTLVESAHPVKGSWWRWVNPLFWLNKMGGSSRRYEDIERWDVDCIGRNCGFVDPNRNMHYICDVAPPSAFRNC